MERIIGISHTMATELTPPELVTMAAEAGFRHVGFRLSPARPDEAQHPMIGDTPMMRDTLARLADTGVSVFDFDIIRLRVDTDVDRYESVLDAAARLGARHALVAVDDADEARMADVFGELCDRGRRAGIDMSLEFMPWTGIRSLRQAQAFLGRVDRPNARVLVDAIHLDRAGETAADVARTPRAMLGYAQICDAPAERPADLDTMLYHARYERMFPGEGELDLAGLLRALPRDLPLAVEVPTQKLAPARERAVRALAGLRALLDDLAAFDATQRDQGKDLRP